MARLHMPQLYNDVHKSVMASGRFTTGQAWAITVKHVAKGCLEGLSDLPGTPALKGATRARYCAAYAQWKKDRPGGTGYGKNKEGRG